MGIRELRLKASALKITGYSRMNKVQLEAAISAVEAPASVVEPVAPVSKGGTVLSNGNRLSVLILPLDTAASIGQLLGNFSKSECRQIRRLLRSNGFARFAGVPRDEAVAVRKVA